MSKSSFFVFHSSVESCDLVVLVSQRFKRPRSDPRRTLPFVRSTHNPQDLSLKTGTSLEPERESSRLKGGNIILQQPNLVEVSRKSTLYDTVQKIIKSQIRRWSYRKEFERNTRFNL